MKIIATVHAAKVQKEKDNEKIKEREKEKEKEKIAIVTPTPTTTATTTASKVRESATKGTTLEVKENEVKPLFTMPVMPRIEKIETKTAAVVPVVVG